MKKYYYLILIVSLLAYLVPLKDAQAVDPKFRRPLNALSNPVYYNYYDNDTSGNIQNYNCFRDTTYNGHQGTDFKADVGIYIYAGANGGLYYRYDSCYTYGSWNSNCGGGYGNHARIDHEGNLTDGIGWVTIYAHMKQGTVIWPMCLMCSAYIGQTGSSGKSTAPHLHFEVKKYSYPNNDPFAGPCSGWTSFWVNQNGGIPTTQCQ